MKKNILVAATTVVLCGCSDSESVVEKCPKGNVYNEHDWAPIPGYFIDGNLAERCKNCGLERMFIEDVHWSRHYGAVYKYKTPKTGRFDDYWVSWDDENGHHLQKAETEDIVKGYQ